VFAQYLNEILGGGKAPLHAEVPASSPRKK